MKATSYLFTDLPPEKPRILSLVERFGVPPFSVLDARAGYWLDRKSEWLALGIQSELGREDADGAMKRGGIAPVVSVNGERVIPREGDELDVRDRRASKKKQRSFVGGGLTIASDSGNDPQYYAKKRAKEAELGRTLTTAEFQERYYEGPGTTTGRTGTGTSVFDPVLCELVYRWFVARDGLVLDPFAGGSVRGIVAGVLKRRYLGVDLSARQVAANEEQRERMDGYLATRPEWRVGDSREELGRLSLVSADLLFTCPPYFDLEIYSDDPRDLSRMSWDGFQRTYREILASAVRLLAPDSFAVVVMGNCRDGRGILRDLVGETIRAMVAAGTAYYNEAILIPPAASAAIRAGQFSAGRKLVRVHQTVLVFVKGDPRRAAARAGVLGTSDAAMVATAADDSAVVWRCSGGPEHLIGCGGYCGREELDPRYGEGAHPE